MSDAGYYGASRARRSLRHFLAGRAASALMGVVWLVWLAGQLPPAEAFWSLTMYDPDFFFVPNPINRYELAQRDKLKVNADGSIDMYLQAESPGADKEANWLPAPKGKFNLVLRIYQPRPSPPSILDGSWTPPPVTVAD